MPEYPTELIEAIIDNFAKKKRTDTVLDIGYGGGQATFDLALHFKQVLAWDFDIDILELADERIRKEKIKNIKLEQKSEENITELKDESLKLVVVAQSLHDIDGEKFFSVIIPKISPGGGIAIISGGFIAPDGIFGRKILEERDRVLSKVVKKYIRVSNKKVEKSMENVNKKDYTTMLADAGFSDISDDIYEQEIERSTDQIIGWLYANQLFAKDKFGQKSGKFEKELTKKLKSLSPNGVFIEKARFTLIMAKK